MVDEPLATLADYRLIERISDDVTGQLYLADAPARLGRPDGERVAIKLMHGGGDDAFRRFTRELQAFAAVRSPHIVQLFDAGQQDGRLFYTMEYGPLGSLAHPLKPLDRAHLLHALACAADAAHTLHEAGLAHRNIQPAAVWLWPDGAKLAEFGLVFGQGRASVSTMASIEAVEYVDPGVVRGEQPSRATDVYSLGATINAVLSGTSIYPGIEDLDPLSRVRRVLRQPPLISPTLSEGEASLVAATVAADQSDRLSTAAEVARELEALAEGVVG